MSHLAKRATTPRRQRGIASILIVVLIGVVMIVVAHGVFRAVRGAQEQTLAVHARTPAEATAWYAAEGIRRYIKDVDAKTLQWWIDHPPSSGSPITLTLSGEGAQDSAGDANVKATIVSVQKEVPADADDKRYLATALITGEAGAGRVKAAAPIEVVYRFQLQSGESSGVKLTGPIFKGLLLKGNPKFPTDTDFNVLGSVEIAEINSTGTVNVRDINATTTVSINSAISARNIHANGDVVLTQKARADKISSGGNVTVSGDGTQGEITAEKDVIFKWSRATLVNAGGNLVVGEPYPVSCKPGGNGMDATTIGTAYVVKDVTWHSCSGGIETLYADGDLVRYHGNALKPDESTSYAATQHLRVKGSMNLYSMNGPLGKFTALEDITYGPTPRHDPTPAPPDNPAHTIIERMCSNTKVTLAEANTGWTDGKVIGYAPEVQAFDPVVNDDNLSATTPADKCDFAMTSVPVPDVPEFSVEPPRVDAKMLRDQANFEFGIANGALQVTVRKVIGMTDGVYRLGWKLRDPSNSYGPKSLDFLCPEGQLDASSTEYDGQKKCLLADARRVGMGEYGVSCFHFTPGAEGAPDTYLVGAFAARGWDNCLTTARGIYYFPGDLDLGKEAFVATWIATHNIRPLGEHRTIAPKPAGFAKTCQNAPIPNISGSGTIASASLANTVSESLCGASALNDNDIGNIAMIAGHYLPDGSFAGGDITTSGTNKIEGLVVAGDTFTSRGTTTVKGNIVASGQGGGSGSAGDFLNDFTLELPTNSDWNKLTCMEATCTSNAAEVLWARYR